MRFYISSITGIIYRQLIELLPFFKFTESTSFPTDIQVTGYSMTTTPILFNYYILVTEHLSVAWWAIQTQFLSSTPTHDGYNKPMMSSKDFPIIKATLGPHW